MWDAMRWCPGELRATVNPRGADTGSAPQVKRIPLGSAGES